MPCWALIAEDMDVDDDEYHVGCAESKGIGKSGLLKRGVGVST